MILKNTKFLIVGLGLIGGSYALGLKQRGYHVSAIDTNEESIAYAMSNNIIDAGSAEDDQVLINEADIIILGLYPNMTTSWLAKNQMYCKTGCIITDTGGVKCHVLDVIQQFLRKDVEFIGAHPMAGKEVSGVRFSDEAMFLPANFIITPTEHNTQEAINTAEDIANILRFRRISILSPKKHDEMIGFLSQLTHVIAVCLMNTHESEHYIAYTGDSFRDLTRIAKINAPLWSELFLLNQDVLLEEIDAFSAELQRFRDVLSNQDAETMQEMFISSTNRRKAFDL